MNLIPVGSSECERGFSQMILIVQTEIRNSLAVCMIADLLFIKLNAPNLELWDARSYVLHWLRTHNIARKLPPISQIRSLRNYQKATKLFIKFLNESK